MSSLRIDLEELDILLGPASEFLLDQVKDSKVDGRV